MLTATGGFVLWAGGRSTCAGWPGSLCQACARLDLGCRGAAGSCCRPNTICAAPALRAATPICRLPWQHGTHRSTLAPWHPPAARLSLPPLSPPQLPGCFSAAGNGSLPEGFCARVLRGRWAGQGAGHPRRWVPPAGCREPERSPGTATGPAADPGILSFFFPYFCHGTGARGKRGGKK